VSLAGDGTEGNGSSSFPSISRDGHYVTFSTLATNLIANDTNGLADVLVRDNRTRTVERISVNTAGEEADGESYQSSMSGDGRYVAFTSLASNLVSDDSNSFLDVFLRDRMLGVTSRLNVDDAGRESNAFSSTSAQSISADGSRVVFQSFASNLIVDDTNNVDDVFLRDVGAGTTTRVSVGRDGQEANGPSYVPTISEDGRYISFSSRASNLVADDTNDIADVFVYDTVMHSTVRANVDTAGLQETTSGLPTIPASAVSAGGQFVVFEAFGSNLVSNDTNDSVDVFLRDFAAGTTERVSVARTEGNRHSFSPSISANGCHVAFTSLASNLATNDGNGTADVFLLNRCAESPESKSR
jgi:Tol biopolymer transport system component